MLKALQIHLIQKNYKMLESGHRFANVALKDKTLMGCFNLWPWPLIYIPEPFVYFVCLHTVPMCFTAN